MPGVAICLMTLPEQLSGLMTWRHPVSYTLMMTHVNRMQGLGIPFVRVDGGCDGVQVGGFIGWTSLRLISKPPSC